MTAASETSAGASQASGSNVASRAVIAIVALTIGAVFAWRVLDRGLSTIDESTGTTRSVNAGSPAEAGLEAADVKGRLHRNPTDYMALMAYALEAERRGDRTGALDAIDRALRLAPADARVLEQSGGVLLRAGSDAEALRVLQRQVELHPGEAGKVWPVMILALDSGRFTQFFASAARDNPSWWTTFFNQACPKAALPGLQAAFATRVSSGHVTADERRCLIGRMQREGKWVPAYQLWLNSLPKEQQKRVGFVFNGEFEYPMSNLGFDWQINNQDGVSVATETTDGTNGRRALHLTFVNKRFAGPPLHEYLMLSPGRYRFEGRGRAEGLNSWLGLQWGLYCHDASNNDSRQLAVSDSFLGSSDWTDFHQDFMVSRDCPLQILRLELANPRRDAKVGGNVAVRLRGSLWFDDLRVKIQ